MIKPGQVPDPPLNPDGLEGPIFVHDDFFNDLPADFTKFDSNDLLIHRINVYFPGGTLSSVTGARLQGTSGDNMTLMAANVPCLVEELGADEIEKFARRGTLCSHTIYLGAGTTPDLFPMDAIIKYQAGRIFRIVFSWDEAGEGMGIMPQVQVKEL